MQFIYHKESKKDFLKIKGELYNYLFKVRRFKKDKTLLFRNLEDGYLYYYKIEDIKKKEALLKKTDEEPKIVLPPKELNLFWCIVDPKTIEKTLPMLNEIGVKKISFLYCDRSQKNFRLNFERFEKILINSSMQCGRSSLMQLDLIKSIDELENENLAVLDFCEKDETKASLVTDILVGCEGGFSKNEREKLKSYPKIGFKTPLILKSETAVVSVCSKILI